MENTPNQNKDSGRPREVDTWTCNCGAVFYTYDSWLVHHYKMIAIDCSSNNHNTYRETITTLQGAWRIN